MELEKVSGIGSKSKLVLNKLGIYDVEGLLNYYPFRYNVLKRSIISDLAQDDNIVIDGFIEKDPSIFFFGKRKDKMTFKLNIGSQIFIVIFLTL